tara:strand:- start:295 stop:492 length:198 start_codon:yes stop_codon:yes gene_type:complete
MLRVYTIFKKLKNFKSYPKAIFDTECCGHKCEKCVWTLYFEELQKRKKFFKRKIKTREEQLKDIN